MGTVVLRPDGRRRGDADGDAGVGWVKCRAGAGGGSLRPGPKLRAVVRGVLYGINMSCKGQGCRKGAGRRAAGARGAGRGRPRRGSGEAGYTRVVYALCVALVSV